MLRATEPPPDPTGQLERRTLADQLHSLLRQAILSGERKPGTRLIELELGRQYRVSQATVRAALKRLAHEGLILQVERRGSYVAEISEKDTRDAYAVRAVLEQLAAGQLCREPSADVLAELARLLAAMREAAVRDDVAALVEHDIEFHRTVWHGAGNSLLGRIWPLVEVSLRSSRAHILDLSAVAEAHAPLLDALRSRDVRAASAAFGGHFAESWHHGTARHDPPDGAGGEVS